HHADHRLLVAGVVEEDPVTLLHGPQVLLGQRVGHPGPRGRAVALQVGEAVRVGLLLEQPQGHDDCLPLDSTPSLPAAVRWGARPTAWLRQHPCPDTLAAGATPPFFHRRGRPAGAGGRGPAAPPPPAPPGPATARTAPGTSGSPS